MLMLDEMLDAVTNMLDELKHKATRDQEIEINERIAKWLRQDGWHVFDNNDDLRSVALDETDLVEPE